MAHADSPSTIHQTRLSNGLTVLIEEMPWLPSVSFQLLLPVGSVSDPEGFEGSATVLNDWLYRGANGLSSREFSDALDSLGLRRGGGAGGEYMTFSASLLKEAFPEALERYADVLRRPTLADDEFENARMLSLQELASLDDNPTQRLFVTLSERYFASAHGRSPYGTPEGIGRLTPDMVRADYARRISPHGMILAVAGGLRWQELLANVEQAFGDWQGEAPTATPVQVNPAQIHHIQADTAQVQIGVAYESVTPGTPGWYENSLATSVLSGGMGSRLFSEVREKRGLVYSVTAVNRAVRGFGYTLAYAGTTPERASETLQVLLGELERLREGVTHDELERARTGILSQLVMQGESSSSRASALARDAFLLGEPRSLDAIKEAVQALSLEDVNRFLAQSARPSFTVLTLGPQPLEVSA